MKYYKVVLALIVITGLCLLRPLAGFTAEGSDEKTKRGDVPTAEDKTASPALSDKSTGGPETQGEPVYNPPLRGAPGRRTAAGTRGAGDVSAAVSVLAPDHVGLTTQGQPSLYWFLSDSTNYPIIFSIIEVQAIEPLVEVRISQSAQPGIQRIRLADYDLRLKHGVEYQWFVAIVPDPEQRSKDYITKGSIELVDLPVQLRAELEQADKKNGPFIYAKAGLWYDAISSLSDLIASAPGNAVFRTQRAGLLRQVGLPDAAEYEMKR